MQQRTSLSFDFIGLQIEGLELIGRRQRAENST
jgi:hypothetical protein